MFEEVDEQTLWCIAGEIMADETEDAVIIPCVECVCAGCDAARLSLLPFLPVMWH